MAAAVIGSVEQEPAPLRLLLGSDGCRRTHRVLADQPAGLDLSWLTIMDLTVAHCAELRVVACRGRNYALTPGRRWGLCVPVAAHGEDRVRRDGRADRAFLLARTRDTRQAGPANGDAGR